jgi:dihydrofolate reductase
MSSPNSGKVRVNSFGLSLDGYGAGPQQSLEHPLGIGGKRLHEWFFPTRTFQQVLGGGSGGETGVDDDFAARGMAGIGAWILGRNMFGPVRGPWPDDAWKGWWGDEPPYHCPVFVLTHHARDPIEMRGGRTFHLGGLDLPALGYDIVSSVPGLRTTHVTFARKPRA